MFPNDVSKPPRNPLPTLPRLHLRSRIGALLTTLAVVTAVVTGSMAGGGLVQKPDTSGCARCTACIGLNGIIYVNLGGTTEYVPASVAWRGPGRADRASSSLVREPNRDSNGRTAWRITASSTQSIETGTVTLMHKGGGLAVTLPLGKCP